MAALKKSQARRVSWNPKLCQVRLFVSEDAPSQSGFGAQDLLQAKPSWLLHAASMSSDDSLPPGFGSPYSAPEWEKETSNISLIKWQCPPEIVLNPEWLVVAGEESEEVAVEKQRQLGVLEAIYPHPSLTPRNPFESLEARDFHLNDLQTPVVPVTAIEDEEESDTPAPSDTSDEPFQNPSRTLEEAPCNLMPDLYFLEKSAAGAQPGVGPDIAAAASAAFTAIMRSNEEGSLIDSDLLIKILSNPTMIDRLAAEYGPPKEPQSLVSPVSAPLLPIPRPPPSAQFNLRVPFGDPTTTNSYPRPSFITPTNQRSSPVADVQIASRPVVNVPLGKDVNYYKSLIQQHGEQRQAAVDLKNSSNQHDYHNVNGVNNVEAAGLGVNQRDIKPKVPKACFYFNSGKGCRYGANCAFRHEESFSQHPERQNVAKRVKLDREIMGRN